MKTILKLLGRIQSNYWGGYIPPGFGTPVHMAHQIPLCGPPQIALRTPIGPPPRV